MTNLNGSWDFKLAYELHKEINPFGVTENAILPKTKDKENYKPRTLIDQTLELIDPTPNIHTLFVQFNERFFYNHLLSVEVKWSNRMTSCAGTCTFHPRNRQCVITISAPLLKLRPRKDLVETLLHEMIHAYLFLTNNNRDRDGHGPEFCKHMNRINKTAGTKITIYHSFHDEVRVYQQHWWRCNGPCQKKAPYFGTVRRSMNRAPGPTDFWWKEHQQNCAGQFIKIREPENFKSRNAQNGGKGKKFGSKTGVAKGNGFGSWIPKSSTPVSTTKSIERNPNSLGGIKTLGGNSYGAYNSGKQGLSSATNSPMPTTPVPNRRVQSYSGILGGPNTGRSKLLDKYDKTKNSDHKFNVGVKSRESTIKLWVDNANAKNVVNKNEMLNESNVKLVECPVCDKFVTTDDVNKHIDFCLMASSQATHSISKTHDHDNSIGKSKMATNDSVPARKRTMINESPIFCKEPKLDQSVNSKEARCPVCDKPCQVLDINQHLDKCLKETTEGDYNLITEPDISSSSPNLSANQSALSISSTSSSDSSACLIVGTPKASCTTLDSRKKEDKSNISEQKCLVCDAIIAPNISLNDHLEDCIGSVFSDESTLSLDSNNAEETGTSHVQNDSYPCPVCMELVSESCMNQHLDKCLKNS